MFPLLFLCVQGGLPKPFDVIDDTSTIDIRASLKDLIVKDFLILNPGKTIIRLMIKYD